MLDNGSNVAYVYANDTDKRVCELVRERFQNASLKMKTASCSLGINANTFSKHACPRSKNEYVLFKRGLKECEKIREHIEKYGEQLSFVQNGALPYLDIYEEASGILIQATNMTNHHYSHLSRGLSAINSYSLYQEPSDSQTSPSVSQKSSLALTCSSLALPSVICKEVMLQLAKDFPSEKRLERYAFIEQFKGDITQIHEYYQNKGNLPEPPPLSYLHSTTQSKPIPVSCENSKAGKKNEPEVITDPSTANSKEKSILSIAPPTCSLKSRKKFSNRNTEAVLAAIKNDLLSLFQPRPHHKLHIISSPDTPITCFLEQGAKSAGSSSISKKHREFLTAIIEGDLSKLQYFLNNYKRSDMMLPILLCAKLLAPEELAQKKISIDPHILHSYGFIQSDINPLILAGNDEKIWIDFLTKFEELLKEFKAESNACAQENARCCQVIMANIFKARKNMTEAKSMLIDQFRPYFFLEKEALCLLESLELLCAGPQGTSLRSPDQKHLSKHLRIADDFHHQSEVTYDQFANPVFIFTYPSAKNAKAALSLFCKWNKLQNSKLPDDAIYYGTDRENPCKVIFTFKKKHLSLLARYYSLKKIKAHYHQKDFISYHNHFRKEKIEYYQQALATAINHLQTLQKRSISTKDNWYQKLKRYYNKHLSYKPTALKTKHILKRFSTSQAKIAASQPKAKEVHQVLLALEKRKNHIEKMSKPKESYCSELCFLNQAIHASQHLLPIKQVSLRKGYSYKV